MMSTMTFERFDELASAHGAAIALWPNEDQAAAMVLADTSPEAQAVLDRERALDEALDAWEVPAPSDALMARILGDAAEISAAAPIAESTSQAKPEKPSLMKRLFGDMGWRPAGALAACLAIAVFAGLPDQQAAPPLTDAQLAQQVEDAEVLTAFFGDGLFDDDDLFDTDAEFL